MSFVLLRRWPSFGEPAASASTRSVRHDAVAGKSNAGARSRLRRSSWIVSLLFVQITCAQADPVVIGSKKFTESYVLGEIARQVLNDAGIPAAHRQGMGGTI